MSSITTTEPADAAAFVGNDPDDATLTFLAQFTDSSSGEGTLDPDVVAYLTGTLGQSGVVFLGRSDGTGGSGTSVSVTGGGTSQGTWTLDPGATGDIAKFLVMHAGEGKTYQLYQIDVPGTTGNWDTSDLDGHGLSFIDLFGGVGATEVGGSGSPAPEPTTLGLLGAGLAGLSAARRRKRS